MNVIVQLLLFVPVVAALWALHRIAVIRSYARGVDDALDRFMEIIDKELDQLDGDEGAWLRDHVARQRRNARWQ